MTKNKNLIKTIILTTALSVSFSATGIAKNSVYALPKAKSVSTKSVISFTEYTVRAKKVKVRATASLKGKTNATLYKGKSIYVLNQKNGWSHIQYNGKNRGWVQTKYLEKAYVPAPRQIVIGKNTQLKQSNSTKSKTIRTLKKNTVVFYAGSTKNGWYKVEDGHYCGWVLIKHTR